MLVHRRVTPSIKFIHLGGEGHCESEVSCPRTQHNVPGQGSNPERSVERSNHEATAPPRQRNLEWFIESVTNLRDKVSTQSPAEHLGSVLNAARCREVVEVLI